MCLSVLLPGFGRRPSVDLDPRAREGGGDARAQERSKEATRTKSEVCLQRTQIASASLVDDSPQAVAAGQEKPL